MRELNMSMVGLARETGLSETTIRYIGNPESGHNKSTLVAISAVLRWRYDHLINVLRGEPEKNVPQKRLAEANLQRLLRDEVDPVREELGSLRDLVQRMDAKMDSLISAQLRAPDSPQES